MRVDANGALQMHEHTRTWAHYVERLLPADAVLAIRRVAVDNLPPAAGSALSAVP